MVNTKTILTLWLGKTTDDMIIFTQLSLVYIFIYALNNPITTIIQATGNIKKYSVFVESFIMLSLPITYLFFYLGFAPKTTFVVSIFIFLIAHLIRLLLLKKQVHFFKIKFYNFQFVLPSILFIGVVSFLYFSFKLVDFL